jgi:putative membrane-bound dehydrogenase-like protein
LKHLAIFLGLACALPGTAAEPAFEVPSGFSIRRVSPSAITFPMFGTLDDKRRLYVTESSGNDLYAELKEQVRKCRVSLLEDRDGDGHYETATVFADNLTPSMGLVWRNGKLYIADPPDLVSLEDTNGDGRADKRTVILTGFGHTDNGSLHGLTFGPDGWLYFTTGNPDGYDLHGPDGSHARGQVGALLRCQPDGSRVETIARGFENLVEIVFLTDGSIIGTDTWYQLPESGVRDALVHLLEEGQYPIHPVDPTVPHLQFNAVLPAVALFPAVAHSGLEIYHGTAFPPEMRGSLFSAQHNARKIVRHKLTPKGSSYACETFDFVTTEDPDVHFSDVLQDDDGSLLVIDTGSWYVQHCPTGRIRQAPAQGGIYLVSFRRSSAATDTAVSSPASTNWLSNLSSTNTITVAAAARMLGRLGDTDAAAALTGLLRSPNPGLRLAAAEAIPHCGGPTSLPVVLEALAGDTDAFLEHALTFALYRLASASTLLSAIEDPSPKVQRAALLLLDQPPFQAAPTDAVISRLNAADLSLRNTARWILRRHHEWDEAGAAFLLQLLALANPSEADRQALTELLPLFGTNASVASAVADVLSPANHAVYDDQRARLLEVLSTLELRPPPGPLAEAILHLLQTPPPSIALPAVRAASALRIPAVEQPLAAIARDPAQSATLRLEATRELVRRRPLLDSGQMDFLLAQISATNLPTARLAAAEVLASARLNSTQTVTLLKTVRADPIIAPNSILDSFERGGLPPDCSVALLDYIAASLDAGWTFPAERLAKLQAVVPESQRAAVDALLARLAQATAYQRQQLTDFAPLLTGGDYTRGEKIFFEKAQCITCHRIWENGGRVGPDLSRVGAIRSGRDLLESILIPSATIAQGYNTLVATTTEGDSYTGVRVGTTDNPLRLRLASGTEIVLHPSQIERIDRSKVSLMPEGLLSNLTRDEIRDLMAFLQHLK